MVSVSTGESSEDVSALSPALAKAKAQTGTKSRTAKASSSAGQRPELRLISRPRGAPAMPLDSSSDSLHPIRIKSATPDMELPDNSGSYVSAVFTSKLYTGQNLQWR